jgi:uncharacterized membrane protein YvlD (DUF360 family)
VVTVLSGAYLATSILAACASLNSGDRKTALLWLVVSLGVLSLGVLRIANAALWADDYLRNGLHVIGWYDERRPLQILFIAAFAIAILAILGRLRVTIRRGPLTVATCGFFALTIFAAIRSSSFHWSDAILARHVGLITLSHATQTALLAATSAAAVFDLFFLDRFRAQSADAR